MADQIDSQDPAPAESSVDQFASALAESRNSGSEAPTAPQPNEPQEPTAPAAPQEPADTFGGHPAWKPFQEKLGQEQYSSIEPLLRDMNAAFEAKITAQNARLEQWKHFESVDPGQLAAAWDIAQRIDSNPLAFYQQLEGYLRQNGLIEEANKVAQAAESLEEEDPDVDPRLAQLQQQVSQLNEEQQRWLQFQQQQHEAQQREEATRREYDSIGQEIEALKAGGADDKLIAAVIDRAELLYYRTQQRMPLADIHRQIVEERAAILNQPRPVDRAPRLPGASGGAPAPATVDLSTAGRAQSVDTFAAMLAASRAGN